MKEEIQNPDDKNTESNRLCDAPCSRISSDEALRRLDGYQPRMLHGANSYAQIAETIRFLKRDNMRLGWIQFNGARVGWSKDSETCRVSWDTWDGDSFRTKPFDDWRAAIDAAMRDEVE